MKACNFIDPTAVIGFGTKVWHFAVILADVRIGNDCSIGSNTEIGRGSSIGDCTRISSHVFLPAASTIRACVFIGPGTTFTDDRYPIAGNFSYTAEPPIIDDHASIGAGCVILPGVHIGHHAIIGAGSTVTKDVPAYGKVYGPAAIRPQERPPAFDPFSPALGDEAGPDNLPSGKVSTPAT